MFSFIITYRYLPERHDRLLTLCEHIESTVMEPGDEIIISDQSLPEEIDIEFVKKHLYVHEYLPVFNHPRAINRGIELSRNPYIITTDVDVLFPARFLESIKPHLTPNTLLMFDIYENTKMIHSGIPGFCTVFGKNTAKAIGGWPETYGGHGHDDNAFRDRMWRKGVDLLHLPIPIEHLAHPLAASQEYYRGDTINYIRYIKEKLDNKEPLTEIEEVFIANYDK